MDLEACCCRNNEGEHGCTMENQLPRVVVLSLLDVRCLLLSQSVSPFDFTP